MYEKCKFPEHAPDIINHELCVRTRKAICFLKAQWVVAVQASLQTTALNKGLQETFLIQSYFLKKKKKKSSRVTSEYQITIFRHPFVLLYLCRPDLMSVVNI